MNRREQLAREWEWDTEEELDLLVFLDERGALEAAMKLMDEDLDALPMVTVEELIEKLSQAQ